MSQIEMVCLQLAAPPWQGLAIDLDHWRAEVESEIAGLAGADVIVLPELWPTSYFNIDGYRRVAEPLEGSTVAKLWRAATAAGAHVFGGSFIECDGDALHHTSLLVGPGAVGFAADARVRHRKPDPHGARFDDDPGPHKNARKFAGFQGFGPRVVEQVPLVAPHTKSHHPATKRSRMGYRLHHQHITLNRDESVWRGC